MNGLNGQMDIFDFIESEQSDFPCDDCIFDEAGSCDHIVSKDYYCVEGSFRVTHRQIYCSECNKKMSIHQSELGSDWAKCRCGISKIFNNQGNRMGWLEAWRKGQVCAK